MVIYRRRRGRPLDSGSGVDALSGFILLEDGCFLLQENDDKFLLEGSVTQIDGAMLLENGVDFVLLEIGDKILFEGS